MVDVTLIIEIITLIVFLYLLYRWFGAPIGRVLRQRADQIEAEQRAAAESQRRAAEMQQEMQRQLEQAHVEAQGIVAAAHQAADVQRKALAEQAQQDAAALAQRAQDTIRRERQAAVVELRREAGRVAIIAAGQVVARALDTDTNRELADQTIADVGRISDGYH